MMKTILSSTERREGMSSALQTALLLARRFDSYIEGFALQPGINQFLAVDMGASIATESFRQESIAPVWELELRAYCRSQPGPECRLLPSHRRSAFGAKQTSDNFDP